MANILKVAFLLNFLSCQKQIPKNDDQKLKKVYEIYDEMKKEKFPKIRDIDVQTLMENKASYLIVDIRTPEERKVSYIPNSISKEEFTSSSNKYKGRKILAYCTIGYRSGLFVQKYSSLGFEIVNLRGSLLAWMLHQGGLVNDKGETRQVHVFGKDWDYSAAGYIPTW